MGFESRALVISFLGTLCIAEITFGFAAMTDFLSPWKNSDSGGRFVSHFARLQTSFPTGGSG
jgi:hypothetical protein